MVYNLCIFAYYGPNPKYKETKSIGESIKKYTVQILTVLKISAQP